MKDVKKMRGAFTNLNRTTVIEIIIKVINHSRPFDLMARATLKRSPVCVPVRNISVIAVNNKVANQIVLLVWE